MIEEDFQQNKKHLYKTELCLQYMENQYCKYGKKCQYAHGVGELRDVKRHRKYKSKICESYVNGKICPYGKRCYFLHEEPKKRLTCFEKRCPSKLNADYSEVNEISDQFKDLLI